MPGTLVAYAGLFLWSFLAATVLPLSSEVPLAALVYAERTIALPVLIATLGNYSGACTTYWLGRRLATAGPLRRLAADDSDRARRLSLSLLRRYGQPALVFSWVPLLGDALVAVAGFVQVPFAAFSLWVTLGKGLRYLVVALAAAAIL